MGKNLKQVMGLGEKVAAGEDSDQKKAFAQKFRAELRDVADHLAYTSAHAEEEKHRALVDRREKVTSAFQATLKKIKLRRPEAAEQAINRVLESAKKLEAEAGELHSYAKTHYTAWTGKEDEFDTAAGRAAEMVGWGYPNSERFEQVVGVIRDRVKLRKYKEAAEALKKLNDKLPTEYDDYVAQHDAKIAYDQMVEDNRLTLVDFSAADTGVLGQRKQEIDTELSAVWEDADALNYVDALFKIEPALLAVESFLQGHAYEAALAEFQPRLDKLQAEYKVLSVADLGEAAVIGLSYATMQKAADDGDFVEARGQLTKLAPEVDAQLNEISRLQFTKEVTANEQLVRDADAAEDYGLGPLKELRSGYQSLHGGITDLAIAKKWEEALSRSREAAASAQAFLDKKQEHDELESEKARLSPSFATLPSDSYLSDLSGNPKPHPTWAEDVKLFREFWNKPAVGDYKGATEALRALEPRLATLENRVKATDIDAKAKAEAAENEIRALIGVSSVAGLSRADSIKLTDQLRKLQLKKKTQLLEDLHGHSSALTPEQRIMQQAIYEATELDKSFEEEDLKIRQQYLDELRNDEQLQDALAKWNDTDSSGAPLFDREAKEQILKRVIATQSKAYGIDEPGIVWSVTQNTAAAEFMADSNKILVDPAALADPEDMVNAILHENTHNFQDELKKKYQNGQIDEQDPMYEQAKMFAINYSGDGYVTQAEQWLIYELQPMELHAIDAGNKGSMWVMHGV